MALYYSVLHKPRRQHLLTRTFINLKIAPEGPPPSSPKIASLEYKTQQEIASAPLAPKVLAWGVGTTSSKKGTLTSFLVESNG